MMLHNNRGQQYQLIRLLDSDRLCVVRVFADGEITLSPVHWLAIGLTLQQSYDGDDVYLSSIGDEYYSEAAMPLHGTYDRIRYHFNRRNGGCDCGKDKYCNQLGVVPADFAPNPWSNTGNFVLPERWQEDAKKRIEFLRKYEEKKQKQKAYQLARKERKETLKQLNGELEDIAALLVIDKTEE